MERAEKWDVLDIVSDFDEVLGFQVKHMHRAAWKANIGAVRRPELTEQSYTHMRYNELWKVSPLEAHNFVLNYIGEHSLELTPVEGARENLTRIKNLAKEAGKRVRFHVLTSRSTLLDKATNKQVDHYYPGIFEKPLTLTGNPKPEPPIHGKGYYYEQIGFEERASGLLVAKAFLDDGYKNVKECIDAGGGLGIVFGEYDWNLADLELLNTLSTEGIYPVPDTAPVLDNVVPLFPKIVACEGWDRAGQMLEGTFLQETA